MVGALQEKVKAEQESRMVIFNCHFILGTNSLLHICQRRALEDLERNARLESERARQMFEAQQASKKVRQAILTILTCCDDTVCRISCI